ncbi:MAG: sel1 repeat family protein [Alphaproteobacteria bacterium]|nr:sel1 repeat family protein [Alphaproteobacteria bacterium]
MTRAKTPGTKPAKARAGSGSSVEAGFELYRKGDFKGALEIWRPLAEAGDPSAQAWLGSAYANGEGVALDDVRAFQWYLRSAEGGNAQAQANVGAFYLMAKGVAKNEAEGVRWLESAAAQGDDHAAFNLAVLYTKGQGVKEDKAKAAALYRQAAERGHYPSQARLGHAFANGVGVEKNRIEAFTWLSLAGQHGIGTALQELEAVVKLMSIEEKQAALKAFETLRARLASETGPSRLPIRLGG